MLTSIVNVMMSICAPALQHILAVFTTARCYRHLVVDKIILLSQIPHRYPQYDFIAQDQNVSISASPSKRYSEESLRGVVIDVELLSQTDFLVCTFTSNVSRKRFCLSLLPAWFVLWRVPTFEQKAYKNRCKYIGNSSESALTKNI